MFGINISKLVTGRINQKHYATPAKPRGVATLKVAGQTASSEETSLKAKRISMATWFQELGEWYLTMSDVNLEYEAYYIEMAAKADEWSKAMMTSEAKSFLKYYNAVMEANRKGTLVL